MSEDPNAQQTEATPPKADGAIEAKEVHHIVDIACFMHYFGVCSQQNRTLVRRPRNPRQTN
jgi:hypothetical protein